MEALSSTFGTGGLLRSPSFTLKTALSWLGHECGGICPSLATEWRADVWYLPRSELATLRHPTLVEVAFTGCPWSVTTVHRLLRDINHCVRSDRILVRERNHRQA